MTVKSEITENLNINLLCALHIGKIKNSVLLDCLINNNSNPGSIASRFLEKGEPLLHEIMHKKISMVNISEESYPPLLKHIHNPPVLLFYKGDKLKTASSYLAIVGTRNNSAYGKDAAIYLSEELSKLGITIVSGMAAGIDFWTHRGALEYEGGTVGVLGCGIDIIYPKENKKLFDDIINNGSIVSEYMPGTPPLKNNFPARNRLISGFSMGTVVIEAPEKSGALITAEFALNQNREVFAVPGSIFSHESRGCNNLLKNGAKPSCNVDDIISEIQQHLDENIRKKISVNSVNSRNERTRLNPKQEALPMLTNDEKIIFDIIGYNPRNIEAIMASSGMSIDKILGILSELQFKNLIFEKSLNHFVRLC
jgi:DNA processing protein